MISEIEAVQIANRVVAEISQSAGEKLVVVESRTVRLSEGWLFFYNSKLFVETGDVMYSLAGNGPIYVGQSGSVHKLSSAVPWEDQIGRI